MSKRKDSKKIIIGAVVLAMILIGGGASAWYIVDHNKIDTSQNVDKTQTATETAQELVDAAVNTTDAVKKKDSAKKLQSLVNKSDSKDDKATYSAALIEVYINTGDYGAAVKVAEAADTENPTDYSASVVADSYEMMGDYKNAAKYYAIAASRADNPHDPTQRAPYNDYMNAKRAAEAKR